MYDISWKELSRGSFLYQDVGSNTIVASDKKALYFNKGICTVVWLCSYSKSTEFTIAAHKRSTKYTCACSVLHSGMLQLYKSMLDDLST